MISGCLLEEEVDYALSDLPGQARPVEDFQECARLCQATDGCSFWTYSSKICYQKASSLGKTYHRGAISGQKACGVPLTETAESTTSRVIKAIK